MKSKILKILSLVLALILIVTAFASCNKDPGEETSDPEATSDEVTSAADTTTDTDSSEADTTADGTTNESDTTAEVTTADNAAANVGAVSKTPAEILAIYTEVMNKAKTDKPAYKKSEYQEIPADAANRNITQGSGYVGTLLGLVDQLDLITPKEEAIANPEVHEKNNDMKYFPVNKSPMGCLLTDPSAIKQATYENLANGNVKVTIILNDENKPEPAAEGATTSPSKTGGMFAPLSAADINETLHGGVVSAVLKDVQYDLTYHDCKATLEFNPATKQIVDLEQIMIVKIYGSCKALLFFPVELTQELYNTTHCYEFAY